MSLKGKAKIELFKADTGERVKTVEEENMFTNALTNVVNPDFHEYLGTLNYSQSSALRVALDYKALEKKLLGGIMLFSNTIPESVDNIIPKVSYGFLGSANVDTNFTVTTKRGSINNTESTYDDDSTTTSISYVWDFTTEQCNGTISALALTSNCGGACGVDGIATDSYALFGSSDFISQKNQNYIDETNVNKLENYSNVRIIGVYEGKYVCITHTSTNTDTQVDLQLIPPVDGVSFSHGYTLTNDNWVAKCGVQSKTITTYCYYTTATYLYYNGKVYIIQRMLSSTSFQLQIYDLATDTTSTATITVSSTEGAPFYTNYYYRFQGKVAIDDMGYMYILPWYDASYNVYKVKLSDYTSETLDFSTATTEFHTSGSYTALFKIRGEVYVCYISTDSFSNYTYRINQDKSFTRVNMRYKNCRDSADDYLAYAARRIDINDPVIKEPRFVLGASGFYRDSGATNGLAVYMYYPYLATINNLETPVVKTNSLTMKITYTITEVASTDGTE